MKQATPISSKKSSFVATAGAIAILAFGLRSSIAGGDPAAGQQVFARCAVCHATVPGQNKIGPSLAGVVGRKSGTVAGYDYSPALKNANLTWDDDTLDKFLAGPAGFVHGTKMFVNVPSSTDRQNVIAYLDTLTAH
jgi:cytochrome c2